MTTVRAFWDERYFLIGPHFNKKFRISHRAPYTTRSRGTRTQLSIRTPPKKPDSNCYYSRTHSDHPCSMPDETHGPRAAVDGGTCAKRGEARFFYRTANNKKLISQWACRPCGAFSRRKSAVDTRNTFLYAVVPLQCRIVYRREKTTYCSRRRNNGTYRCVRTERSNCFESLTNVLCKDHNTVRVQCYTQSSVLYSIRTRLRGDYVPFMCYTSMLYWRRQSSVETES